MSGGTVYFVPAAEGTSRSGAHRHAGSRAKGQGGMIYFLRAGAEGPVKIGWAKDVSARTADLQTGHYERLLVLRVLQGDRTTEHRLHAHYRERRIIGEWFRFCPSMLIVDAASLAPPTCPTMQRPLRPIGEGMRERKPAAAAQLEALGGADGLIAMFGGVRALAAAIGAPLTTVYSWRQRNALPHYRLAQVLIVARDQGLAA